MKKALLLFTVIAAAFTILRIATQAAPPQATAPQTAASVKAFIDRDCASCHNNRDWIGNLVLENQDFTKIGQNRAIWEKVVRKLKSGQEPKTSLTGVTLEPARRKEIVAWFDAELDRNAPDYMPPPGLHRLNRTEYKNAIKDILDLDIVPSTLLPQDDSTRGFDNIARALRMTPELAAAYVKAAATISRNALASAAGSASARKVFICRPANTSEETPCAQRIVANLATQAFRRPASTSEVSEFMESYHATRLDNLNRNFYEGPGGSIKVFDRGIEAALREILNDRRFIYRREVEPPNLSAGQSYRISDLELASRLSYFLWSRGPDAALIDLASRGQLRDPAVLEREARRMLADPRAEALTTNFAGQWLSLWMLAAVGPLPTYPDFDDALKVAMRRESELFFESIVREDRNVVDLLTANYTFVNDRLARHYGIPNITGSEFRRITLDPAFDVRRGLLGKAAFLTGASNYNFPERTSLVVRGNWVLTKFLGLRAPDPPPNVPPLKTWAIDDPTRPGVRDMMASHQNSPSCNQCHKLVDPIGISLENFDRTGKWRTDEFGKPIDATDVLVDGTPVRGPADLRNALMGYSDQFVATFTESLLTFSLGRGTEYGDMPLIRTIARDAAIDNNRFSAIVLGIVKSRTFQMNSRYEDGR